MKALLFAGVAGLALAAQIPSAQAAAILVTEVMSSGSVADWFELTNTTNAPISLANYRIDDNSFSLASAVPLVGVSSIAAGESVIFVLGTGTNIAAFRSYWGGAAATAQIGSYIDSGTGFSNGGDAVVIYDGNNAEVTRVSYGSASTNVSFTYTPASLPNQSGFGALSVLGQNASYASVSTPTNIGSPGAIPEPCATALLLAGVGMLARRPARRTQA